jgi:hypothetical protein
MPNGSNTAGAYCLDVFGLRRGPEDARNTVPAGVLKQEISLARFSGVIREEGSFAKRALCDREIVSERPTNG